MIMRLHGEAKVVYPRDATWNELIGEFPEVPGIRQLFDLVRFISGYGAKQAIGSSILSSQADAFYENQGAAR